LSNVSRDFKIEKPTASHGAYSYASTIYKQIAFITNHT